MCNVHLVTDGATNSDKPSTSKTAGQSAEGEANMLSNSRAARAAYSAALGTNKVQGDLSVIT